MHPLDERRRMEVWCRCDKAVVYILLFLRIVPARSYGLEIRINFRVQKCQLGHRGRLWSFLLSKIVIASELSNVEVNAT